MNSLQVTVVQLWMNSKRPLKTAEKSWKGRVLIYRRVKGIRWCVKYSFTFIIQVFSIASEQSHPRARWIDERKFLPQNVIIIDISFNRIMLSHFIFFHVKWHNGICGDQYCWFYVEKDKQMIVGLGHAEAWTRWGHKSREVLIKVLKCA